MERWIEHYSSAQKILLVGEGDFSFSAYLARAFCSATSTVGTSLESQVMNLMYVTYSLWEKHRSCVSHLDELKRRGCLVLHDVDVYDMDRHDILKWWKFDVVSCNKNNGSKENAQELVDNVFRKCSVMLNYGGEVHVTTRNDYPYITWNVEQLAEDGGLFLREKVLFEKSDYPGYHNKRSGSIRSNKTFRLSHCYTFKFLLQQDYSSYDDDQMSVCSEATSSDSYYMY